MPSEGTSSSLPDEGPQDCVGEGKTENGTTKKRRHGNVRNSSLDNYGVDRRFNR